MIGVPDERWGERPLRGRRARRRRRRRRSSELARVPRGAGSRGWQLPELVGVVDELPKTATGKFDKKVLRAAHAAGDLVAGAGRGLTEPRLPRRRGRPVTCSLLPRAGPGRGVGRRRLVRSMAPAC